MLIRKLSRVIQLFPIWRRIVRNMGCKRLVVDMSIAGELPFLMPLLMNAESLTNTKLYLTAFSPDELRLPEVREALGDSEDTIELIQWDDMKSIHRWLPFDAFVTCEQFTDPPFHPAICMFHGQPSKGITFTKEVVERYEHFFTLGPLHELALNEFITNAAVKPDRVPQVHRIGFPRTDRFITSAYTNEEQAFIDSFQDDKLVILYAPAFNQYASLRTNGCEVIRTLASVPDARVLVKLAPDMTSSAGHQHASGGGDWQTKISELALPNVMIVKHLDATPSIVACDVMVTDVSGVSYEAMQMGKPVVFIDCPDFYENVAMPKNPGCSLQELLARDTVNVGRNYGIVVSNPDELIDAVSGPLPRIDADFHRSRLLYNPGSASKAMIEKINELVNRPIPPLKKLKE